MNSQFKKNGLLFQLVEASDAEFILELRTDPILSRFLSNTEKDINKQISWINNYKKREYAGTEFYFIALTPKNERIGLNRIYNINEDFFEIGSWLYKPGLNASLPILGDLAVRDFAFENTRKSYCKFEVRKDNASVIRYHKAFNPELTGDDELNFYFRLSYENYMTRRDKLLKAIL